MTASHVDPERVRAMLARTAGEEVDVVVRETHISWVFLAGERAYKLKKPLVLPFIDYSTAARRRQMCDEELRLNRRLAPTVYIDVRGLAAAGEELELVDADDERALDYVVEMRRYDEARTLAATLRGGQLAQADIEKVARVLAEFHARCRSAPMPAHPAQTVEHEIDVNFAELMGLAELGGEHQRLLALWRSQSTFVAARRGLFEVRAQRGLIKDCHGDLRAEHVLLGEPPAVVDCVEFDPALRALDVADDLAFLLMELHALGSERLAEALAASYRQAGGDPGDDTLLAFYGCHRALVRAKVLLIRATQLPSGSAAHDQASEQAHDLLALAERLIWGTRLPLLIVVCGRPASGKTELSRALRAASGLAHISSDLTRKQLAGIEASERAPVEFYSDEFSHATYGEMGRRAAADIAAHGGAIVDATFRRRADREAFAAAFADAAPVLFLQCVAPEAVLAQRAVRREHGPHGGSDATLSVVLAEGRGWEGLDEVAGEAHLIVRSDRPAERIILELAARLDERLWPRVAQPAVAARSSSAR